MCEAHRGTYSQQLSASSLRTPTCIFVETRSDFSNVVRVSATPAASEYFSLSLKQFKKRSRSRQSDAMGVHFQCAIIKHRERFRTQCAAS